VDVGFETGGGYRVIELSLDDTTVESYIPRSGERRSELPRGVFSAFSRAGPARGERRPGPRGFAIFRPFAVTAYASLKTLVTTPIAVRCGRIRLRVRYGYAL
jgi:hypothetical protein